VPYTSALNRWFNSVWAVLVNAGVLSPPTHGGCPNGLPTGVSSAADTALTGGGRANAFFKTGTVAGTHSVYGPANFSADYLGHDGHTGYVDLAAMPARLAVPSSGGQLYQAANTANLPFTIEWWADSNGILRRMPSSPSIGTTQQTSPPLFGTASSGVAKTLLLG
jgi:hypothetical protein